MSEQVKRYTINGAFGSASVASPTDFVLASDYDAMAQRCQELDNLADQWAEKNGALLAEVERLKSENEDLVFALSDAEQRADNAGRNASAFEDSMGDLQVANGKLVDEVNRLLSVIADDVRVRHYKDYLARKRGKVEDGDL